MALESMLWKSWAEVFFILLLLIGFFISIAMPNPWVSYIVIILAGLISGRLIYKKKGKQPLFPFFLIVIGFLLGYILGTYPAGVNTTAIAILFIISTITGYYIHKKGYIKI